jgi:hypothetical protein
VNIWLGRAAMAAIMIISLSAGSADAQITTVISAPKRAEAKQAEAARREEVAQDSAARVTLTDMKAWVDSAAAALALRPDTGAVPADSAAAPSNVARTSPRPDSSLGNARAPAAKPAEFRDGARAPDTATAIPTLALAGGALLVLGFALRLRTLRAERQRA